MSNASFIAWRSSFCDVSQRKAFLLRIDPAVLDAVQQWANDDLRSLNGQIEFLLRRALRDSGRARAATPGIEAEKPATDAPPPVQS